MVEIELSILAKQCLDRRIDNFETLKTEVLAWVKERNTKQATVSWQFTKDMARDKFHKFYPILS
jgi:predicted AAA+ superfamily ATPase